MPPTEIIVYQESPDDIPLLDWFEALPTKAKSICNAKINDIATFGNELRRPAIDYLENGIYELRIKYFRLNYRILYSFVGRHVILLTHGITKEKRVPVAEIERAIYFKQQWDSDPEKHSCPKEILYQ
jgi:phage-related protein